MTRQSLQTDRVRSLASDIRAWGISTHNSLRSQEPSRPQSQDLDLLTARHWTRLGLQARQPGSPSGLRTPRFDPVTFNPQHSPLRPVSYIPGRAASIFGGSAFRALDSLGESTSPAPRGIFGGSAFQALGPLGPSYTAPCNLFGGAAVFPRGPSTSTSPAPPGVFGGSAFRALGAPPDPASPAPRDLGAVPRRPRDT